ncbi:hypothetical protein LXA43DRAFT_1101087 [Ganoderma leucocontextum]|nr:hypothetical protein LXA43DRAFT_1101087 [Ganoderma leucocontextum]
MSSPSLTRTLALARRPPGMASARQQIRIAIALAALRHKPSTQSILAYILDLQSAFPVSAPDGDPNRLPSPNPWRQRVLLLEKDLQDLQSQYDKEKIELLSLRKAAIARSKETKKRTRETDSVEDTADSSATRKKGRQKRQKPVPVVCATDDAAPPIPETEPQPQSRPGLGAIAGGSFVSADIPTVPAFLASLDSFDAMADMLDADAPAVPLDLLLSTTRRALRALGALLSACLASSTQACSRSMSSSGSSSSPTSRMGIGFVSRVRDSVHANADAASGVRDPLRALDLLDASLHRVLRTVFSSLPAHFLEASASINAEVGPQQSTQMQTRAALDDVLGCLYTLVLAPLVRAFAPASEGFVSACLGSGFCSGSGLGFGSGSGSGISYGEEYPLPGSGGNSDSDNDSAMADLRPVLFDVLERTLSVLELEGQSLGVGLGLGSSGAGTDPIAGESGSHSDPAGNGGGGHTSKGLGLQAIPGVREVKRLLALDCVRELERMYTYASSAAETSDPSTDPNIRRGSDVPPGGSGDTRQGEGSQRHSLPRELLALWQGSARTCARKAHGWNAGANRNRDRDGSGGASEDPTRPGTAASRATTTRTNSALGPLRVQDQDQEQASAIRLRGAAGPPRSAGNLGETRVAGGGRDLVRSAGEDAAPGLGFAHAQGRSTRREREREREGEDLDLRGEDGLGKRFTARTVRLARKDAAWYLCAVLNRLLSGSAAATPSNVGVESAASSSSNGNASSDASRPRTEDVDNANANANACAKSVNPNPKLWLTNKDSGDTDTVADEAVYAALVDLLRRTRPAPSSFLPGRRGGGGNDSDSSTRTDTAEASIHDDGSSAGGADRHERQHTRGGELETVAMGEVERGMLLAVFERAWLGT